jgi:ribosomal protein S18 acetylase RimI-like enzyme
MAELLATVRPARVDDAAALHELGLVVIPATYDDLDPAEARRTAEEWWSPGALASSLATIPHWVAETDDRGVVGVANLGSSEGRAVIWKLYVHPEHQGAGLGRALLAEVVAASVGKPLWLSYVAGNRRASSFYAAHGFVEEHRAPNPPFPDQVWMRRDPE